MFSCYQSSSFIQIPHPSKNDFHPIQAVLVLKLAVVEIRAERGQSWRPHSLLADLSTHQINLASPTSRTPNSPFPSSNSSLSHFVITNSAKSISANRTSDFSSAVSIPCPTVSQFVDNSGCTPILGVGRIDVHYGSCRTLASFESQKQLLRMAAMRDPS